MKTNVNYYQFRDWFYKNRPNNFSEQGLQALWEICEEYEESTGQEMEFDPIALCCEYTEYDNIAEFWLDYDQEKYPDEEAIMDATFYWAIDDESFIIQQF
jgi:hypothetical protein